ncbi:phosphomevalonate kinase [Pseudactinotalea sp. Z1732]|uniref:phosphomevalonate kinase n=1 Tax=Pseudactinotalea sp. Z1732 TaxID=3413026 RepID=UPI003C7BBB9B
MIHAPGKLFIAGEYAVVEPGGSAVLVAVDRYVSVRVAPAQRHGTVRSAHYGPQPLRWERDERARVVPEPRHRPLDHVLSAVRTVEALVADLGIEPRWHSLDITSELDDADGRKYGLGSSAAVTVAVVRALDQFYGLGLTAFEQFKVALLATVEVAPSASGGDVAASTFGGWLAYHSPDRAVVAALRHRVGVLAAMRASWPLLQVTPLPAPSGLDLIVGWTGAAASTTSLVAEVRERGRSQDVRYETFLAGSRARVQDLITGLQQHDSAAVLAAVREARNLLIGLGAGLGIEIETPALAHLVTSAERIGAAGKASGAGGGDCGIVLAPCGSDLEPMLRDWERSGVRRLPLAAAPRTSAVTAQ